MMHKIKKYIKKILVSQRNNETKFLLNVFDSCHQKRALVSYITKPFLSGLISGHTNTQECYAICKILEELNYIVDVVDYDYQIDTSNYEKYQLIYGFGESLENSFLYDINNISTKIVYGTGCDTVFSNYKSLNRVKDFYKKTGILCMNSARYNNKSWRRQVVFSDLIISLGNDFVKNTFNAQTDARIESLPIFYKEISILDLSFKDYNTAKFRFLWWGSTGAIHKGLDLVIDAFSRMPDFELHICGYSVEYPFHNYYTAICANLPNIHDEGFVKIGSDRYQSLMEICGAVVFPSISEGGAAGIVQLACDAGIIPIITANVGLDIPFDDFMLKNIDSKEIEAIVRKFVTYDFHRIRNMSLQLREKMRSKHSYEVYYLRLRSLIQSAENFTNVNYL